MRPGTRGSQTDQSREGQQAKESEPAGLGASQGVIHRWGENEDPEDMDSSSGLGKNRGQVDLKEIGGGRVRNH